MTIDWDKPIELVGTASGFAVPTSEPTEYIGPAVGQPHYSNAVRAWGKVYLVAHDGEIQGYPEFRIRNVREPQYRPYTPDELAALVGTAVRRKHSDGVVELANKYIPIDEACAELRVGTTFYMAEELCELFEHLDGTPCGVLVEDDDES